MADTLDLISLTEAKLALNIASAITEHDAEIAVYITAASRVLDARCGPIVNRTITAEKQSGGYSDIWLDRKPVSSVTTVTEYDYTTATTLTAETNASKPAEAYMVDLKTGRIRRRSDGGTARFADGIDNIEITYVAGRAADTASVDEIFKRAAGMLVQHNWRRDRGAGTTTFGDVNEGYDPLMGSSYYLPRQVRDLVSAELLPPGVA